MKKAFTVLLLGTVALLMACASSGPRVVTNSDPMANFSNFETYNFVEPLSSDNGNVRTLTSSFLIEATIMELQAHGLKPAGHNPDLLVNFFVVTEESDSPRQVLFRDPHYVTWSKYNMQKSTLHPTHRTEGTIGVDVIDNAKKQLVWEGAATGMVTESMRDNLQQTVNDAIADIFADFPN